jgi:hypothetical protein
MNESSTSGTQSARGDDKYIVACRPFAKQWICKHRLLLGNVRNIYACNSRCMAFSVRSAPRPLLCNVAVNTPLQKIEAVYCVVGAESILRQLQTEQSSVRGLNLAADKTTSVQVSNCRFLCLNIIILLLLLLLLMGRYWVPRYLLVPGTAATLA